MVEILNKRNGTGQDVGRPGAPAREPGYGAGSPLLGREWELAYLTALLRRARGGQGRLVLVGGAAGVGKTHLLRELRRLAEGQAILVGEGSCAPQGHTPYQPWVAVL